MDIIPYKPQLNTIEDNRWKTFQQGARRRRVIAIGATASFVLVSLFLHSVLPFLIGEVVLWLAFKYWIARKKNKQ